MRGWKIMGDKIVDLATTSDDSVFWLFSADETLAISHYAGIKTAKTIRNIRRYDYVCVWKNHVFLVDDVFTRKPQMLQTALNSAIDRELRWDRINAEG